MEPPKSWGTTSLLNPGLQSAPPPGHSDSGPVGWQAPSGSPSPHSRLPIRRGRTLPYCRCEMEAFRLRGHPQPHACAGRACVEISEAGWRHGQSRARLADPRLQPASPASQLAASVSPSVRQQRYPTRLSQAPARDRGPR